MATKLFIPVIIDDKGSIKVLDKTARGLDKVDKEAREASKGVEKTEKSFGGMKSAMLPVVAGLAAIGAALKKSITLFAEQDRVEAQLNAVLLSTGEAAGFTADELKKMAGGFQEVTKFGDEAIIGAQNVLLTFTNIKDDVFPGALEAILNVSESMGTGLKESAIQLGKALNDPVLGISALNRVGITFTQDQKDTIKSLVEMGDTAGAQTIILKELETQFGGSAKAAADTLGGAMTQAGNIMGDVGELIGGILAPAVIAISKFIRDMGAAFIETVGPADEVIAVLKDRLAPIGRVIGFLFSEIIVPAFKLWFSIMSEGNRIFVSMIQTLVSFALTIREQVATALAVIIDLAVSMIERLPNFIASTFGVSETTISGLKKLSAELRKVGKAGDEAAGGIETATVAIEDQEDAVEDLLVPAEQLPPAVDAATESNLNAAIAGQAAAVSALALRAAKEKERAAHSAAALAAGSGAKTVQEAARKSIVAAIGSAIAVQFRKVITALPFPINIIAAPVAAVALRKAIERSIPKFQMGGDTPGGLVKVGEGGPELVDLPAGSRVFNADESREIEQGGDTFIVDQRGAIIGRGAMEEIDERLDDLAAIGRSKIARRLS